jgi:hypothetical protein
MNNLTEQFANLDKLIGERSGDVKQMRDILDSIRSNYDIARFMGEAQDKLYASIARGHRKVLVHLEAGDSSDAMREAAKAIAWFHLRFQHANPSALTKYPHIAEELLAVRELAARSEILRDAVSKAQGGDIHVP